MSPPAAITLRILGRLIGAVIVVGGLAGAVAVARLSSQYPRTDDAYVRANVIGIAPHVEGPLVQLNVVDNQEVEANDPLFVIDPRPYEAELQRAKAELIVAQAEVGGIQQAIAAARAEIDRLQADTDYATAHARRQQPLVAGKFISADQYQEAVSKAAALKAAVRDAQFRMAQQEKLLAQDGPNNGRIDAAKARVRLAELNLEYCYVRAPFKALVTNLNIAVGNYAHVGERIFALVDQRQWYVVGNFRETLLPAIKPGMLASINLVGYPGRSFHGVVQGIAWSVRSPAGQELELLPKVDPTLNWARLAQRIPVRIIMLDPPGSDAPYRMGMTAVATITGVPPDGKPLTLSGMSAAVLQ
jgi:multidrug efflux system membrane fusion protein